MGGQSYLLFHSRRAVQVIPDNESRYRPGQNVFSPAEVPPKSSSGLGFAILALGLLAGFVLGWVAFVSPWTDSSRSRPLFDENKVRSLFEEAGPAVVEITLSRPTRFSGVFSREDSGSGFLIDREGHIATNNHVIDGEGDISVRLSNGRVLEAQVLGTSPLDDLALLQVDPAAVEGIDPLPLADSDEIVPGQLAVAIGSPFEEFNSVTVGIVSGTGRTRLSEHLRPIPGLVQTDAALNPGNSGGPLLNSDGEVMGVNTSVQVASSIQIGIGYAVPSNTLKHLLPQLITRGQVRRPWMGITSWPLSESGAARLGLPAESEIYLRFVCEGGPAHRAGLRGDPRLTGNGDMILSIDGEPVSSMSDMVDYFNLLQPTDVVRLEVHRSGATRSVDVVLDEWPVGEGFGTLWRPFNGEPCPP